MQRLQRDEHEAQSQELAEEENPFRHGRGVGDLAEARFPLAPDQFARIEDDEQRNDDPVDLLRARQWSREKGDHALGRGEQRHAHVCDRSPAEDEERRGRDEDKPPQLFTIAWKDSRATASIWRAWVATERPLDLSARHSRYGRAMRSCRRVRGSRARISMPDASGMVRETKPEVRKREHAQRDADPQDAVRRAGAL